MTQSSMECEAARTCRRSCSWGNRSSPAISEAPCVRKAAEDGLLQVREIRSLRLQADLVTLSACDTGLGRIEGQEGMANLVRSFLFAGARNVAAALWEVDDVFTMALMKRLYTRLSEGADVAASLQMAKADLRRNFGVGAKGLLLG